MDLSNIPPPLLAALSGVVGGLAGWIGRGLGFVLKRWWIGSPKQDQAAYLNTVTDIGVKLHASGMTIDDVRQLEAMLRDPSISSSGIARRAVEEIAEDAEKEEEQEAFNSNFAMKIRTGAAYKVAEAKLERVLLDLRLLLSPRENEALQVVQRHWREYRSAVENCALIEYEGGTHGPLAMMLAGLSETERRADELHAQVVERSAR
jgi:uncharacterized protein YecT (DUF1311 family)